MADHQVDRPGMIHITHSCQLIAELTTSLEHTTAALEVIHTTDLWKADRIGTAWIIPIITALVAWRIALCKAHRHPHHQQMRSKKYWYRLHGASRNRVLPIFHWNNRSAKYPVSFYTFSTLNDTSEKDKDGSGKTRPILAT